MPEITEKLAGHSAANKVGGMRVSNPKVNDSSPTKNSKQEELSNEERIERLNQANMTTLISGTPVKLEDAYPAEAVKRFHDKPMPTVEKTAHVKPNNIGSGQNTLFQPRRQ